ncbi:MAG TPA: nuclear transport factor 2 family protein [Candidatus Eisenbacteria bacterium]|jgi:hypothetical protein|nr:nuclear transport factor 2 family protein [Candidatus Eisenbacteria bacterium]
MRRFAWILLFFLGPAGSPARAAAPATSPHGFDAFLKVWEAAQDEFINGDDTAWKKHVSAKGDATILGAFGGYEAGAEVLPRFDWAASQYEPSKAVKRIEYLTRFVSDDLAVTVAIERDRARVKGRAEPIEQALRATQVFRWENGSWKLVHRHADPLLQRKPPSRP